MELRHLRYFVAVAEELHFRRAAERLHVAQPAVSEQVRKLEQGLGVRLLERTHRRVSLTPAGDVFLVEARHILQQAQRAQSAAISTGRNGDGRLRLGILPDAVPPALPGMLGRFATATPGVDVALETYPSLQLTERVRDRRLDAAVLCLPAPVSGLQVTLLGEEGVVVGLGETHPAANGLVVSPRQLERTPLLVMPRTTNPAFFDGLIAAWRNADVAAAPVEVAVSSVEQLLLTIAAGASAALLPRSAARRFCTPGVRFLPLSALSPTFEMVVITHPENITIATSMFLQLVHAISAPAREIERTVAI